LITCFNIVLGQYIKELLERAVPGGVVPPGIEVRNFHNLVYKFIGPYDDKSDGYLKSMTDAVVGLTEEQRYDTVLIDEGQDFQPEWVRILVGLAKTDGDVIFTHDPLQGVYGRRRFEWKEVGLDISAPTAHGRRKIFNLPRSYRNTKEIVGCAAEFLGEKVGQDAVGGKSETMPLLELSGDSYKKPVLIKVAQVQELIKFVGAAILRLRESNPDLVWSDFGILMANFKYKQGDGSEVYLVDELSRYLVKHFGENFLAVLDPAAKREYRHFSDSVKLMRLDACKGLEWKVVFVIGLDHMPRQGRQPDDEQAMAYVGLTRATRLLLMPYTDGHGGYIAKIKDVCDPLNKDLWGDVTNI
jgi:superfamily I DNA/RNA helicase